MDLNWPQTLINPYILKIHSTAHQYSTTSSDSSTITKIAVENTEAGIPSMARRPSTKWRSSLVYFMDPCIEDCTLISI